MDSVTSTYGTVKASETLTRTSVAHVLLGQVQSSGLPAAVFVFGRYEEPQAVQQWLRARALRSMAAVVDVTIVDAQQTAECFFVCLAWPPTQTPSALPASLARTLAWMESASRDDLGIRVTDVLRSLERLEPRQVPRTVMLEPGQLVAAAAGAAKAEPAVNPPLIEPASPSLRPTRLLHQTTLTESPVILENNEPGDSPAAVKRWWIGLGLGVGAVAGVLAALYMRGQEPESWVGKPATTYPSQSANPPAPVPLPAPAAMEKTHPPAPPTAAPDKNDDAPSEVVVATRPAGTTVCDPKTRKILGRTPLRLPADRFNAGHRILLSRMGFALRTFHWPASHLMTMKRLHSDESQSPSPCGF